MKKSLAIVFVCSLISMLSFAQTNDQEAIKKVCLAETQAYLNLEFDTWASYHIKSADEQLSWNNPDGSYGFQSGWDSIGTGIKEWFKTAKKENLKTSNSDFVFVIRGDMAFVAYNSSYEDAAGKITQLREHRTLLRSSKQWKILAVQNYRNNASGK